MLGFVCLLWCGSAASAGYWGVGAGKASLDIDPVFGAQGVEDGAMIKVMFGDRDVSRGLELDFLAGTFDLILVNAEARHTVYNTSLSGVLFHSLSHSYEVFGKLGVGLTAVASERDGAIINSDLGFGLAYGAGVNMNVTDSSELRLEYQAITNVGDGVESGTLSWIGLQMDFAF